MRRLAVILALLLLGVTGAAIVASSMSAGVFQLTVGEIGASASRYLGRELKVQGTVIPGSVNRLQGLFETLFSIGDSSGHSLPCRYKGKLPDPFAEGREVILQGVLREGPHLEVKKIVVKCPSKYQEEGISEEAAAEYYEKKYRSGHTSPTP